jgi:hypothetical protein
LDRTDPCRKRYHLKPDEVRENVLLDLIDIKRADLEGKNEGFVHLEAEDVQELRNSDLQWRNFGLETTAGNQNPDVSVGTQIQDDLDRIYDTDAWDRETYTYFEFLLGDKESASLFRRKTKNDSREQSRQDEQALLSDVTRVLSENCISSRELAQHLARWGDHPSLDDPDRCTSRSLKALAAVKHLYDSIAPATITLEVTREPLHLAQ